jgi:peptidoglycan-associated lipoprotein
MLICSVSLVMPGCKKWWGKKSGSGVGGSGSDSILTGAGGPGADSNLLGPRLGEGDGKSIVASQFDTVLFAFDSAQVEDAERGKVEKVAEFLKSTPSAVVTLEGHCDERGSAEYNMALGDRRALAVREYLMNLGIDGARIQTKSFGKEKPKDMGNDENAWAVNRRVEFVLMK